MIHTFSTCKNRKKLLRKRLFVFQFINFAPKNGNVSEKKAKSRDFLCFLTVESNKMKKLLKESNQILKRQAALNFLPMFLSNQREQLDN